MPRASQDKRQAGNACIKHLTERMIEAHRKSMDTHYGDI
ncbi:hypothetical protein SP39_23 [Salmonella phage 39]|nr:hypothetical protein SP39_23 [Salmonella phage 39]